MAIAGPAAGMPSGRARTLACPMCRTRVAVPAGALPACPSCGYGSQDSPGAAPTPAPSPASPPLPPAEPAPQGTHGSEGLKVGPRGVAVAALLVVGLLVALVTAGAVISGRYGTSLLGGASDRGSDGGSDGLDLAGGGGRAPSPDESLPFASTPGPRKSAIAVGDGLVAWSWAGSYSGDPGPLHVQSFSGDWEWDSTPSMFQEQGSPSHVAAGAGHVAFLAPPHGGPGGQQAIGDGVALFLLKQGDDQPRRIAPAGPRFTAPAFGDGVVAWGTLDLASGEPARIHRHDLASGAEESWESPLGTCALEQVVPLGGAFVLRAHAGCWDDPQDNFGLFDAKRGAWHPLDQDVRSVSAAGRTIVLEKGADASGVASLYGVDTLVCAVVPVVDTLAEETRPAVGGGLVAWADGRAMAGTSREWGRVYDAYAMAFGGDETLLGQGIQAGPSAWEDKVAWVDADGTARVVALPGALVENPPEGPFCAG